MVEHESGGEMKHKWATHTATVLRWVGTALACATLVGSSGCSSETPEDPTELILLVDSELSSPDVIDSMVIDATEPGGAKHQVILSLDGKDADQLPGTLALRHSGGALGPVRVRITGKRGDDTVVIRDASASFVANQTRTLELSLLAGCVNVSCKDGQTCDQGECRAVEVGASELTDWDGLPEPLPTVETDASLAAAQQTGGPSVLTCESAPCDALTKCSDASKGRTCSACPEGYSGTGAVGCVDIDECQDLNGGCDPLVNCENAEGGVPTCGSCPSGYDDVNEDGTQCDDIDECALDNGGCDAAVICRNSIGGPVSCGRCPPGYDDVNGDGTSCVDLDECATNNGGCGDAQYVVCSDQAGALPVCTDIDECLVGNGGCGDAQFNTCINVLGSPQVCIDIDECATDNGGCGLPAFTLCANRANQGPLCTDIDECATNNGGCGVAGFVDCVDQANGAPQCNDVLECATNNGGCGLPELCNEQFGAAATCSPCPSGYTDDNGNGTSCTDILECETDNGGCDGATTCNEQVGADPVCDACPSGYTDTNGDGTLCDDVDECASDNGGCGADLCVNTDGSSACSNVVEFAGGQDHSCALLTDGSVRCWGRQGNGQLGTSQVQVNGNLRSASMAVDGVTDAVQIASGSYSTCARLEGGSITCWGRNNQGQLGANLATSEREVPSAVTGITDAIDLDCFEENCCAVLQSSQVQCWGRNGQGQLGTGASGGNSIVPVTAQSYPTECSYAGVVRQSCTADFGGALATLTGVRQVTMGYDHTCVLGSLVDNASGGTIQDDDLIRCWGSGGNSRLGNGAGNQRSAAGLPVRDLPALVDQADIVSIDAAGEFACAVQSDGRVACWGRNYRGQLGNGSVVDVNGAVYAVGITTAQKVSVGQAHSCAHLADGSVSCWGQDNQGQLALGADPIVDVGYTEPVSIQSLGAVAVFDVMRDRACAILSDGHGYCWGSADQGELGIGRSLNTSFAETALPMQMSRFDGGVMLAAGDQFTCGLDADGGVKCWGRGAEGAGGNGTTATYDSPTPVQGLGPAEKISAGTQFICALLDDQTVWCWGSNNNSQIGSAALYSALLPTQIQGLSGAALDMTTGRNHACALIEGGTVECWGRNANAQFGDPANLVNSGTPMQVPGLANVASIEAGSDHTCAVHNDRTLTCWGFSQRGQAGVISNNAPPTVVPLTAVVQVAGSGETTCAIVEDDDVQIAGVYCWGNNDNGQLGLGTQDGSSHVAPMVDVVTPLDNALSLARSAGNPTRHFCAVLDDGAVSCWGRNQTYGQLGDPGNTDNFNSTRTQVPGLTGVAMVTTGHEFSCALLDDGTATCWGKGGDQQLGNGNNLNRSSPTPINSLF